MSANPEKAYVLIQDHDCRWYVCPADKQREAYAFFSASSDYWSSDSPEGDAPEQPDWLDRVGGAPSLVEFTGYTIR